uniref:Secreted protein n=1 Tax=Caenorhabditis tropicalis TaxID=1561998 RepID=A0A1I7TJR5_9PELO
MLCVTRPVPFGPRFQHALFLSIARGFLYSKNRRAMAIRHNRHSREEPSLKGIPDVGMKRVAVTQEEEEGRKTNESRKYFMVSAMCVS